MKLIAIACLLFVCLSGGCARAISNPPLLAPGDRVVFLGDSLTFDGRYTHHVEAYYLLRRPGLTLDFINVGLPSEGVTGLSEPAHPFPRPDVHERLDRVLRQLQPDVVVACYGMNDGIYHPFSPDRFEAYRQGIARLIERVHARGAKLILMTPPPFDALPVGEKLRGDGAGDYSWMAPYRDYDRVVERYAQWLLDLQDPRVSRVVDLRTPTLNHLREHRKQKPDYTLAPDGVHCNEVGQWLIARALLQSLEPTDEIPPALAEAFQGDDAKVLQLVAQRQVLIGRAWLSHIGHKRPQTPEGEPLDRAQPKAEALLRQARAVVR